MENLVIVDDFVDLVFEMAAKLAGADLVHWAIVPISLSIRKQLEPAQPSAFKDLRQRSRLGACSWAASKSHRERTKRSISEV